MLIIDTLFLFKELYLVMELLTWNLKKELAEVERPLKSLQIEDLITQMAKASEFLHHKNIVHKEIRPSNILMKPQQKLASDDLFARYVYKLSDFNIVTCSPDCVDTYVLNSNVMLSIDQ